MATPPESLPSPSLSSSSHSHLGSLYQSTRASSSASGSQPAAQRHPNYTNGDGQIPYDSSQYSSMSFLPSTVSPPPNPPPYIPPPQHAMPPDPIHSATGTGYTQPQPWPNGPPGPAGWRAAAPPAGYGGYRSSVPNGRHLPTNPDFPGQRGFGTRPGSAHGESRERRRDRRDRDRDDEREIEEEVISTIFVVGFPDDMSEREFQNIFTFAPGFEAATLKFPSGSARREPAAAALLAELTQLAAHQNAQAAAGSTEYNEYPTAQLEEAISSLTLATASTSQSTTPSAPMSLTPSVPSNPTLGPNPLPTRRQTIGFARFKSRPDALAAKDHLQGKKIDALTGAVLKAEMAKKNLHTKKTTSGEELVGMLLRGKLGGLIGSGAGQGQGIAAPTAKEAWDSWSSLSDKEPRNRPDDIPPPSHAPQPSFSSQTTFVPSSLPSANPTSPTLDAKSPTQGQFPGHGGDSKALLALAEKADELVGWNIHGAAGLSLDPYSSIPPPQPAQAQGQQSQSQTQGRSLGSTGSQGPQGYGLGVMGPNFGGGREFEEGVGRDGLGGQGLSGRGVNGANPADQNPPINTLYVGNLPAVSPPTHPPGFLEESLRALFSRCAGFKRMSYRQKINGPMCFVEFEEVGYASQAIKDLYGHNLGGLVKGGIRLSYSKNSLGQRGNNHPPQLNTSLYSGIPHNVPIPGLGMTSPSSASVALPNGSASAGPMPYGLQHQQASLSLRDRERERGGEPGTAPLADLRRESAPASHGHSNAHFSPLSGTSLSPTAQPFNIALPPTSPRNHYITSPIPHRISPTESASSSYNSNPTPSGSNSNSNSASHSASASGVPIPSTRSSGSAFQPFGGAGSSGSTSGFSPVSSPIRTPGSFQWLSTSANATSSNVSAGLGSGLGSGLGAVGSLGVGSLGNLGNLGVGSLGGGGGLGSGSLGGGGYGGFDFGGNAPVGSLNGAASAWGASERRD
ncbi:hypothetical protein L202_07208 [Cryptococcus amylolentus CBS 6039]|uniref:RRM domain-containing protein n=1 Tax=Cryptococcus amylolentus CBS 6039 TaxID=1295533 RepID=A0A1E3HDZ9_9TREE|nr:hypothetical protein L202_07208 [Cryptococcus amylolentus CBS 6039]ODN73661.1 hypothetical protein L202_07208 [Cryptococcus amylolentus CBS 6039]